MKKLLLVRAPGLSPEEAVRGDQAWNVSDLIAEGSFAPIAGIPDVAAAVSGLPKESVTVIDVPFRDSPSFDAELGKVRARAELSALIAVFVVAVPLVPWLSRYLPWRVSRVRRLTAAHRLLAKRLTRLGIAGTGKSKKRSGDDAMPSG